MNLVSKMSLLRCEILPLVVPLHSYKIWRQLRESLVKLKSPKVKTFVNYLTVHCAIITMMTSFLLKQLKRVVFVSFFSR